MSVTRNILPLTIAVVAGVGISVYTLKPVLEEQQRQREQKQFQTGPPTTPEQPVPKQTIAKPGTAAGDSTTRP